MRGPGWPGADHDDAGYPPRADPAQVYIYIYVHTDEHRTRVGFSHVPHLRRVTPASSYPNFFVVHTICRVSLPHFSLFLLHART